MEGGCLKPTYSFGGKMYCRARPGLKKNINPFKNQLLEDIKQINYHAVTTVKALTAVKQVEI